MAIMAMYDQISAAIDNEKFAVEKSFLGKNHLRNKYFNYVLKETSFYVVIAPY